MKRLSFIFLFISITSFSQPKEFDVQKTVIESSKHWLDVDYVGDGFIGHRLDIHLPANGKAPFPIVVAIYGSAFFSNSSKATVFNNGWGQKLLENGFIHDSFYLKTTTFLVYKFFFVLTAEEKSVFSEIIRYHLR